MTYANHFLDTYTTQIQSPDYYGEFTASKVDLFGRHSSGSSVLFNERETDFDSIPSTSGHSPLSSHRIMEDILDKRDLFFVHYVTSDNTLQGISLQYDCPINEIKSINRINMVSHLGDVRIRKVVLIPLDKIGYSLDELKVFDPPHPDKSIHDKHTEDPYTFLQESFSDLSSIRQMKYTSLSDFEKHSGSFITRTIWKDVRSQFKYLEKSNETFCCNSLEGYSFVKNEEIPTFIVKIPKNVLLGSNLKSKREGLYSSLASPKSSSEIYDEPVSGSILELRHRSNSSDANQSTYSSSSSSYSLTNILKYLFSSLDYEYKEEIEMDSL